MLIEDLIRKIEESDKHLSDEERTKRLIAARILTEEGFYDKRYFSKESVEKSKKALELLKAINKATDQKTPKLSVKTLKQLARRRKNSKTLKKRNKKVILNYQ